MTLGAYYAWEENQLIGGDSMRGLGAVQPPPVTLAEEALKLAAQQGDTLGIYTPWAEQEGDTAWKEFPPPWNLNLVPLSDAALKLAKQAAFGQPVGWLAVLTTMPAKLPFVQNAFDGTPYEMFAGEAVYRQDDRNSVPRIYFLYWAKLRDDTSGGPGSLQAVASALGGRVVFPMQLPLTGKERPKPAAPFSSALAAQLSAQPASLPGVAPVAVQQGAAAAKPSWLLLLGVGAVAAAGGWWWVKRRKRGG